MFVIIRIIQHIKNLAGYRPQDQFSGIVDQSATEFWHYTCRKFLFDIVDVPALWIYDMMCKPTEHNHLSFLFKLSVSDMPYLHHSIGNTVSNAL